MVYLKEEQLSDPDKRIPRNNWSFSMLMLIEVSVRNTIKPHVQNTQLCM